MRQRIVDFLDNSYRELILVDQKMHTCETHCLVVLQIQSTVIENGIARKIDRRHEFQALFKWYVADVGMEPVYLDS